MGVFSGWIDVVGSEDTGVDHSLILGELEQKDPNC